MLDLTTAFATFPILATERLRLRTVTLDDTPAIFRMMSDPRVTRYFGSAPMVSLNEATQRIEGFQTSFATQTGIRWAITRQESTELLGTCGYWRLMQSHFGAEIGYELAPDCWGQGIMSEAVAAVLAFGFQTMGLHRVEAQIHPANTGSQRVLEKLGFGQEGYFREHYYEAETAQFTDTAVFSLLKARWLRRST